MLDIDSFKEVNDTYGHLVGDTVLKEMVTAFQIGFREHDRIARWGGDEFVILLTSVPPWKILTIAERIRSHVAEIQHDVGAGGWVHVSVSIGATIARQGSAMDSIANADKAVFQAKKYGGNQAAMYPEDSAQLL